MKRLGLSDFTVCDELGVEIGGARFPGILNMAYAGPFATSGLASQRNASRHYGFGARRGTGTVTLTASRRPRRQGAACRTSEAR